ncbi:MAG TPA: hypothetical protein VK804_00820 [Bradyrhizobium sp.]|uniref:hypothetical protein n=1 Tax=Bradyrhizobium sp. TaxID=376 RepID=UPI002C8172F1|nr:hypothetical protein [Bradyrhizobium sp.]HTA98990.1 hypothetical protein [Bradyrhizobium sp.]
MNIGHPPTGKRNIATVCNTMMHWLVALAVLLIAHPATAQTILPSDADPTACSVSPEDFQKWFADNAIAKDGIVLPANSLTFTAPDNTALCPFFRWSEQMFLWLTSPLGSGHVFDTPQFYEVLPADPASGKRTLRAPAAPGQFRSFAPSIALRGSQGQEVAFDSTGKVHDVVHPETGPAGKIVLLNAANQLAEVGRVLTGSGGRPVLLDRSNKAIDVKTAPNGSPLLLNESGPLRDKAGAVIDLAPATVLVEGKPTLLTTSGAVVETEEGQAGSGGVLMAQNKSLVYYLIEVNDVFAYFKTGAADAKINPAPTQFPTVQDTLDKITTVAQQAPPPNTKQQFPDGIALTMEIKSSWVETAGLANPQDYVTINTTIPTYTPSADNKTWTPSGTKPATLALVGMHVVGSANGHPEMIWATFEHVNNTPNTQYTYKTTSGTVTKPADGAGSWLFSADGASANAPAQTMSVGPQNSIIGQPIGPINVTRMNAWGSDPTGSQAADNNTAVISINNSVIDQLAAGDVRKNYIMIGSIWTNGLAPTTGNRLGTTTIANSTMETFKQPGACFDCHDNNMLGSSGGGGLSHIWGDIIPLFP